MAVLTAKITATRASGLTAGAGTTGDARFSADCEPRLDGEASGVTGLLADDRGATTLEWALLLAAVGLASLYFFNLALQTLIAHYQLTTTINSLPFP
jgi:Flp pilus assembly pilin Flp